MSFDRLAPHYRWMETVLAGGALQRCRLAFLHHFPGRRRALLLGEGLGRFLIPLLQTNPGMEACILDSSAAMLEACRRNLRRHQIPENRCSWIHGDIQATGLQLPGDFDLVATHFFLDCFTPGQLSTVIGKTAAAASPRACWVHSDFAQPARGWQRCRARLLLAVMYRFFRGVTRIQARHLTCPDPFLETHGFICHCRQRYQAGFLRADLFRRR